MPSNVSDIYRPYVAGKLQWPIHQDASVCRLFRGFGMIEFGVKSLPSVAPGRRRLSGSRAGYITPESGPVAHLPEVLLGKNCVPLREASPARRAGRPAA